MEWELTDHFFLMSTALEMKTLLPEIMGHEDPSPGGLPFHGTFFESLDSSGGVAVREISFISGPRH